MPPEWTLFSKACQAVGVPGTVPSLASPSVQQTAPLPVFPPRHSTAPASPHPPGGVKGCNLLLKICATSIAVCEIRPKLTAQFHFCFASGLY